MVDVLHAVSDVMRSRSESIVPPGLFMMWIISLRAGLIRPTDD